MTARPLEFQGVGGLVLRGSVHAVDRPRGRVLLIHGLGEHHGRYGELVRELNARGFSVLGYDHQGHGQSEGARGVARLDGLVDDARIARRQLDEMLGVDAPAFALGHSMGGLVLLRALSSLEVQAAVLSAPWLSTAHPPGRILRGVARILARTAPTLAMRGRMQPELLTRDPQEQAARRVDPLVHQRITPRLFMDVEEAQAEEARRQEGYGAPVLMLVPEADPLVDPRVTIALGSRLARQDVEVRVLAGGLHEPFHDLDRQDVIRQVGAWLERRLASHETAQPAPPSRGSESLSAQRTPRTSDGTNDRTSRRRGADDRPR